MKTILNISVLILLLVAASSQCFAMIELEPDVSKKRAKELGVEIRAKLVGTNQVNVSLEFKTKGELEKFKYAQLQILDGERLVLSATLQPYHPRTDIVEVYFSADHTTLPRCTLMIVVGDDPLGGTGYLFKMKDFIELDKPR